MKLIFHLGLLLFALVGLTGQASARVNGLDRKAMAMQMSSASMSCGDETRQPRPSDVPCKKVGVQCLDGIGCPAMTMAKPGASIELPAAIVPMKSVRAVANELQGRSCAPEPEPPSFLI